MNNLLNVKVDWKKQIGEWYKMEGVKNFLHSYYMTKLISYISEKHSKSIIYPSKTNTFKAFRFTSPGSLKVVILGNEPYYDSSAIGLAFGNSMDSLTMSPSLRKILERVELDCDGLKIDEDITLQMWAEQGVLMLNTSLTIERAKPGSHKNPWSSFTKFIVKYIAKTMPGTIFLLWGKEAQSYELIDDFDISINNYVLKAEDPRDAVKDRRQWICDHFIKTNEIIEIQNGKEFIINW